MKLKYLAHAAFLLTSNQGIKVLTDPYKPGCFDRALNYKPIEEQVDIITISHEHADHNYIAPCHAQAKIFKQPKQYEIDNIKISGLKVFHDTSQGKERGDNVVFSIKIDDIVICHLGDLGHGLTDEEVRELGVIDILLLPVGGIFTIDANLAGLVMQAIKPKICIPMHYKTEKATFGLAPVDDFIKDKNNVKIINASEIELSKNNLPQPIEIWVLEQMKL